MASFTWQALIDRAKTYCDDDHADEASWITPARWLTLANTEYAQLYKRWVRAGLVNPLPTTGYILGTGVASFTGVLAVIGVAKDYGDFIRPLHPAQTAIGHHAFWRGSTQPTGCSTSWAATGAGDTIRIELDPVPDDVAVVGVTSNYVVRYIPTVAEATDPETSIEVPYGADERLVLGIARRAQLKDSGASALLNGLISDADADLNFSAMGKMGGAVVKRLQKSPLRSTPRVGVWPQRAEWIYF